MGMREKKWHRTRHFENYQKQYFTRTLKKKILKEPHGNKSNERQVHTDEETWVFVEANKLSDQGMSLNRSQCLAARRSTAPRPIRKVVYRPFDALAQRELCWLARATSSDDAADNQSARTRVHRECTCHGWITSVCTRDIVIFNGLDAVLEAFRHNPSDGSITPLAARPSVTPNVRPYRSSRTEHDYHRHDPSSVG